MSKYTPGPWKVLFLNDRGRPLPPTIKRQRQGIFSINGFDSERDVADAHLISAAPEMLEALEGIMATYPTSASTKFLIAIELARNVIDKAKGEP